jgi:hypothetical protein
LVPQVPLGAPGGMLQVKPAQQSAVAVQVRPVPTQVIPPSGACAAQRSTPWLSGRHGTPPQHSVEKAQRLPAEMQQGGSPVYPVWQGLVEPP